MLFPVYWMVNVSLTPQQDMRKSPPDLFPLHPTFEGYRAVLDDQLPYLGTSLLIGLGTVALTLVLAAPAGYALAKLRPRGGGALGLALLIAQMIPGIVMAMGFYGIFLNLGLLNAWWGLIVADSTIAVPFGVMIFTAFMSGIPDELIAAARIDGAGVLAHLLVGRPAGQPQRPRHRLPVRLPVGLVRLRLRQHPRRRRRPAADHPRHLQVHRQQQPGVERDHGHRRRRVHPRSGPAGPRPALRGRGRHRRRGQGLTTPSPLPP